MDSEPHASSTDPVDLKLLRALRREHVLAAISRLDKGERTEFAESTKFDLVYQTRRYPPKRVAGLALQTLTGITYGPYAFKGGRESSCFRALQHAGFTIAPKLRATDSPNLIIQMGEVADLQKSYSSENTSDMERRGHLIRTELPNHIRRNLEYIEPLFSARGYSFATEGSDGMGRKVESPWVRIYDPQMSPSATSGWYVVIHFSRSGEAIFLTLGCGATTFADGDFVYVKPRELADRVSWAQLLSPTRGFGSANFSDVISLEGNELSRQFERATAYCRTLMRHNLSEVEVLEGLGELTLRLLDIYDAQRAGQDPLDIHHAIDLSVAALQDIVSPRGSGKGQGRGLSAAERYAVESRAMVVAREGLLAAGFSSIEDVSAHASYDYKASRNGQAWFVEVKGTSSSCCDQFLMTKNELTLHRSEKGKTVLAIVSGIQLSRKPDLSASAGALQLLVPWDPDEWTFEATAYRAIRRSEVK